MKLGIESPFKKIFANPFGATLTTLWVAAVGMIILIFSRIVITLTFPPSGAIVVVPMLLLGLFAHRYNKGLFMGDKEPYEYPDHAGKALGFLQFGLGVGILALGLFTATVPL